MPKEWANNYDLNLNIDEKSTIKTNKMPEACQASELPDAILDLITYVPPKISRPKEVKHTLHIEMDPSQPYGMKVLPEEWKKRF